jgi:hypothetical protein
MVKPKLSSTIHPAPTTAPECAGPACHRSLLPLGVGAQVVERLVALHRPSAITIAAAAALLDALAALAALLGRRCRRWAASLFDVAHQPASRSQHAERERRRGRRCRGPLSREAAPTVLVYRGEGNREAISFIRNQIAAKQSLS